MKPVQKKDFNFTLLYFASSNLNNIRSINYFIDNVFKILKNNFPSIRLLIGGSISSVMNSIDSDILIKGEFEDPALFYKLGDIVINPEISGTGFKIKSYEALSYGLPLISSRAGASGISDITDSEDCPVLMADSPNDYIIHILSLADPEMYGKVVDKGLSYIVKTRQYSKNNFLNSIKKFIPIDSICCYTDSPRQ